MEKLSFLIYYVKLRLSVATGSRKTTNPINWRWRWGYWKDMKDKDTNQ